MNPTVDALTDICRIVAAVLIVRKLGPAQIGAIVAALRDNGGEELARVIIGPLPFDESPAPAELARLTDE